MSFTDSWLDWLEFWDRPWPDEFKLALITPVQSLEPGHGILCRSCRFRMAGVVPYHDPQRPYMVTCAAAKLCSAVLKPEKGFPGLVLHLAGNETCEKYEPEIELNFVYPDPPYGIGDR